MKNARTVRVGAGIAGLMSLLTLVPAAGAQETDVAKEIEELKRGQAEIRRQLGEIKRMLEASPRGAQPQRSAVEGKIFDLGDNPVKGESTAKLTLVEFSDYQ